MFSYVLKSMTKRAGFDNQQHKLRNIKLIFIIIGISLGVRILFIGMNPLLVEEAYYWNYAQHLDFSYLDHPPMVALLIKITTTIFGTHELGVRGAALFCWFLMVFFSFKLTELVTRGAGIYAVFLLTILPYFFIQSVVITPDLPLLVCWSGALYCLYRVHILDETRYWYFAGVWIGLGMLSKYTICLVGLATLCYVGIVPSARGALRRKELYISGVIAALLFMPVIYWNATHEWVSFLFQSTRRINDAPHFSFHLFLGILVLFLMPLGLLGVSGLFRKKITYMTPLSLKSVRFFQLYLVVPLAIFGIFSLNHPLRLTWVGPCLLSVIPWLAMLLYQSAQSLRPRLLKTWIISGAGLVLLYSGMFLVIAFGIPEKVCAQFFNGFFDWRDFTVQVNQMASLVEKKTSMSPIIIPLDAYNITSELNFYQRVLLANGDIQKSYATEGQHYFGESSLMYKYWSSNESLTGRVVLLISRDNQNFKRPMLKQGIRTKSPVKQFWAHSQRHGVDIRPYYYQVAEMK